MTEATTNFGEHITIDGYGGNPDKLNDRDLIFKMIDDLPRSLGMKKLSETLIFKAEGNGEKDPGGWTGMVIINESHISVHTFPSRGFISADVYTCKNGMDVDFILKYFKEAFDLEEIEHNFIKRGTRYPLHNLSTDIGS